jgi:hypothetical protein
VAGYKYYQKCCVLGIETDPSQQVIKFVCAVYDKARALTLLCSPGYSSHLLRFLRQAQSSAARTIRAEALL